MSEPIKHPTKPRNTARKIHFDEVPSIGTVMDYYKGTPTLIGTKSITKKNGTPGTVLVWRRSDGVIGTSGLSSNSLAYQKSEGEE
jgi:hypothetical protein